MFIDYGIVENIFINRLVGCEGRCLAPLRIYHELNKDPTGLSLIHGGL